MYTKAIFINPLYIPLFVRRILRGRPKDPGMSGRPDPALTERRSISYLSRRWCDDCRSVNDCDLNIVLPKLLWSSVLCRMYGESRCPSEIVQIVLQG